MFEKRWTQISLVEPSLDLLLSQEVNFRRYFLFLLPGFIIVVVVFLMVFFKLF